MKVKRPGSILAEGSYIAEGRVGSYKGTSVLFPTSQHWRIRGSVPNLIIFSINIHFLVICVMDLIISMCKWLPTQTMSSHEIQTLGYVINMSNWTYPNWKFDFQPPNLFLPQCSPFQRTGPPIIYAKSVCPPTPESKFSGSLIHLLVVVGAPEWKRQKLLDQGFASRGSRLQLGQWCGSASNCQSDILSAPWETLKF